VLSGLALAGRAAGWGVRFYLRHIWLVAGLSAIPAVQRFVVIRFGGELPEGLSAGTEVLTAVVRLLLVVLIVRLVARDDPGLRDLGARGVWERFGEFVHRERAAFLTQFAVLGAAFVVFDTLPTAAITAWVPDPQAELVMAVLVAAKNPTVIAFTLIWMVAVVRAMVHAAMPADGASAGAASLDPSGATAQASARSDGGASTVGDIQNNGRRTQ
jgi:hypothetical protein